MQKKRILRVLDLLFFYKKKGSFLFSRHRVPSKWVGFFLWGRNRPPSFFLLCKERCGHRSLEKRPRQVFGMECRNIRGRRVHICQIVCENMRFFFR